jgi:hypothetical protein
MYLPAPAAPRGLARPGLLIAVGFATSALVLVLASILGLSLYLGVLAVMLALAFVAWRWPVWAAVFYAFFMSINRFVILVVFEYSGSDLLTKGFQLWKDGFVVVLTLRVLYELLFTNRPRRLRYLDVLVVAFIVLGAAYLIYPGPFEVDPFTRVQGFRTDVTFLFAYLIGRGMAIDRRHLRWLVLALVPGSLIVTGVAIWQVVAPASANHFFDLFGFSQFSELQGTLSSSTAVRTRGINGIDLPRASSLQLGDLALAYYQLFMVAVAAALLFVARSRWQKVAAAAFLLVMLGTLALTGSRSALLATGIVLLAMTLLARAPLQMVAVGAAGVVVAIVVVVATKIDLSLLPRLLTLSDPSALGHASAGVRSLDLIQQQPLGGGLGTAGTIGQRFLGPMSITNENWFLQIGSEMGVIGAVLFIVISVVLIASAVRAYLGVKDDWLRVITLATAGSGLGFLVLGNFLHAWENTVLSIFIWLLAGIAIRARSLEVSPEYQS